MKTAAPTSLSPTGQQVWARARGALAVVALLVAAGITMAALRSDGGFGRLDPRSTAPAGSRAAAELLRDQGVSVHPATTLGDALAAAGSGTTLLVTDPGLLSHAQQDALHHAMSTAGGRTVLLAPDRDALIGLVPEVATEPPVPVTPLDPGCSLPTADRAGDAELGGHRYTTGARGADLCYPSGGAPTLLRLDAGAGGETVLLGAPDLLYNDRLDEHGNASLALQLLGAHPELIWYMPSFGDTSTGTTPAPGDSADGHGDGAADREDGPGDRAADRPGEESSFLDLVPDGWVWGTVQLGVAALLAAVWRARRLGPLVTERLPVSVPAAETAEGRARLYRQVAARERASASLRSAARARLAPLLGVAAADTHTPDVLVPAVAARLSQDAARDPHTLLFGPAPADDAALIRLADQLDALEREVRTS
ncbi:DUF4350 domain-containing protein [Streptomyces sp. C10-9-1]|uniref:DUF4350 domain-containing protein n=1 Tax=Streptomyces sp. C10-9-1 TaxID=1859285 RepID=UPI0021119673|nr:DUF4350 domain-containing protein [Streptomyces sp. C10-9-1]MCQ6553165.1 DUF4350 domain-containing protein [Streptomyces sp. C10-9-1]